MIPFTAADLAPPVTRVRRVYWHPVKRVLLDNGEPLSWNSALPDRGPYRLYYGVSSCSFVWWHPDGNSWDEHPDRAGWVRLANALGTALAVAPLLPITSLDDALLLVSVCRGRSEREAIERYLCLFGETL